MEFYIVSILVKYTAHTCECAFGGNLRKGWGSTFGLTAQNRGSRNSIQVHPSADPIEQKQELEV